MAIQSIRQQIAERIQQARVLRNIADQVLEYRRRIRAELRPRPSRQESFTLAAVTTFLALVGRDRDLRRVTDAAQFAQVIALVNAQQAAAALAASSAASAGAAAS